MLLDKGKCALVFHIWAREDAEKDGAWEMFANDPSNTSALSRLAFGLEGFFQNHFTVDLFRNPSFTGLLEQFKYYPNSSKKVCFHGLLLAKVQEGSEAILALVRNSQLFKLLVTFFIDEGDKDGLMALTDLVFWRINNVPLTRLAGIMSSMIPICQHLGGGIDGSLRHLAVHIGAAAVLRKLDFSRLRVNDMEEMLETLGIGWDQMNAALSSLSDTRAPVDELAEVLGEFHKNDRYLFSNQLPDYHALWFYLWKAHRAAFFEHVDPNIQKYYQSEEPGP